MMLSDVDIVRAMDQGEISFDPWNGAALQPASAEVHLASEIITGVNSPLETRRQISYYGYDLHPGEFILGSTKERVTIGSTVAARIEGKSSLGRLGLTIHVTAGYIDPGFSGQLTLEMANLSGGLISIRPGMAIAQISFHLLQNPCSAPYGDTRWKSHYQGQTGPTPAALDSP